MNFKIVSFLTFLAIAVMSSSKAQNAETLLQNMDKLMSAPKDRVSTIEMTVTNKNEKENSCTEC